MTSYQVVYWRGIPARVKVRASGVRAARALSERFQQAIDEAAMRAGMGGSQEHLDLWRTSEAQERQGEPQAVAESLIAELEAAYPPERLQRLVANGGREG